MNDKRTRKHCADIDINKQMCDSHVCFESFYFQKRKSQRSQRRVFLILQVHVVTLGNSQ